SKGIGVFGTDVQETGIPADIWRFYMYYNRPEKADAVFTWKDFQEKVNGELIGNLANLVNRTLSFINRFYNASIPDSEVDASFSEYVHNEEQKITAHLERAEIRDAFRRIFSLSSYGNRLFQNGEPWKTRETDPEAAEKLLASLSFLIKDLAIMIEPFLPATSKRILTFFDFADASWKDLGNVKGLGEIKNIEILFSRLEDEQIKQLQLKYSGKQQNNSPNETSNETNESPEENQMTELEKTFIEKIDLRVAKITEVQRHPEADKLYIETINFGNSESAAAESVDGNSSTAESSEERQIVSGLVPFYSEEELLGHHIIVVYNLKPAKLRGVKSQGMLLAAESSGENDEKTIEVIFADNLEPGTRIFLEGEQLPESTPKKLKIDDFFSVPLKVKNGEVYVDNKRLSGKGDPLTTKKIKNGDVG
ncbi:MAG: class I tRNA ligase family protein, partial [Spirochaetia bacterium]|nr:class I tRNA ligase family protein [Spirochaetia bacterium]